MKILLYIILLLTCLMGVSFAGENGFYQNKLNKEYLLSELKTNSSNAEVYFWLGFIYLNEENKSEAIKQFQINVDLDPYNETSHIILAAHYVDNGLWEQALIHARQAIKLNDKISFYYYILGKAQMGAHKYEDSVLNFRRAVDLDDTDAKFYDSLGLAYQGLSQIDNALESYRRAIERDNKNAELRYHLGVAFTLKGNYDEAAKACQQAIDLDHTQINYYNQLASVFELANKFQDAIQVYRKASETNKGISYRYAIGKLLYKSERYNEAIETLSAKDFDHVKDPDGDYFLANCYLKTGKTVLAKTTLQIYLTATSADRQYVEQATEQLNSFSP